MESATATNSVLMGQLGKVIARELSSQPSSVCLAVNEALVRGGELEVRISMTPINCTFGISVHKVGGERVELARVNINRKSGPWRKEVN